MKASLACMNMTVRRLRTAQGIPLITVTDGIQKQLLVTCACLGAHSGIFGVKRSRGATASQILIFLTGPLGSAATLITRLIDGLGILTHPIAAGLSVFINLHFPTRLSAGHALLHAGGRPLRLLGAPRMGVGHQKGSS